MNRIPRTWMGQDAARTTAGWSVPDLPAQDLSAGRQRLLPPSRVSPQVVQTIQVKAFSNLLVKVFSHFLSQLAANPILRPNARFCLEARMPYLISLSPW